MYLGGTLNVAGYLRTERVAVVEVGADHQMRVVELTGHEPAVVSPLRQPLRRDAADAGERLGNAHHNAHLHERGPSRFKRIMRRAFAR